MGFSVQQLELHHTILYELDNVKREMENVDKYFVGTKNSHFCLPLALLWPYRVAPFNLSLNNFGVYVNQS